MFRNYLIAALRNLARNRVYALVAVGGLALGLAGSLISLLYLRNELTFERFLPNYDSIYRISTSYSAPAAAPSSVDPTLPDVARWLAVRVPNLAGVARLAVGTERTIRVGNADSLFRVSWADPQFFRIFRFHALAGDPGTALDRPDAVVLTRTLARDLFGRDTPIGATLELDRKIPLRVAAVVADPPANTHLDFGIVGSSRASFSDFAPLDAKPTAALKPWIAHTYFELSPSTHLEQVRSALADFIAHTTRRAGTGTGLRLSLPIVPVAAIHFLPDAAGEIKPRGSATLIAAIAVVGALILLVAAINFVNLSTARATTRSIEVGVRKAVGASRGALFVQFVGEALVCSSLAAVLALAVVELVLPSFNRLAQTSLTLSYVRDPFILLTTIGLLLVLGLAAGAYPAWILSSYRPAAALRGRATYAGAGYLRAALVTVQFAVLTGFLVGVLVVFSQTSFAKRLVERLDMANVFAVPGGCQHDDADKFRALPGVVGAACSASAPTGIIQKRSLSMVRPGVKTFFTDEVVGFRFFDLYGVKPLAGRLFERARGTDAAPKDSDQPHSEPVVINETAVRKFGFRSARDAVGQSVSVFADPGTAPPSMIIGVVPDFPSHSLREPVDATVFHVVPDSQNLLSVRVNPAERQLALSRIGGLWKSLHSSALLRLFPVAQTFQRVYDDIAADGSVFSACAGIALLLAAAGMYGLASFTTTRRTKEIGIRQAMGADSRHILLMLLWRLTLPVLWAQLLAWPICYVVLRRWLQGFAYHIAIGPETFLIAAIVVVAITWMTTFGHAWLAAYRKPVESLRYE